MFSLLIYTVFICVFLVGKKIFKKFKPNYSMSVFDYFIVFLAIAIMTELMVFNYKHFEFIFSNAPVIENITDYVIGDGFTKNDDGTLSAGENGSKSIEILGINEKVHTIYLDIKRSGDIDATNVKINITDDGNALYAGLTNRNVYYSVEKSKYLTIYTAGKSEKLRIDFDLKSEESIKIQQISLNIKRPLFISSIRVFAFFTVLVIGFFLRPSSKMYCEQYNNSVPWQKAIITCTIISLIVLLFFLVSLKPVFVNPPWKYHKQYIELAQSMLEGNVYLDKSPGEALINMDNPYDRSLRTQVLSEAGESYEWDHAYYNGKYYVYFGVTPVLLLYIPYKMLTGNDFYNHIAVLFFSSISVIAGFGLISQIIKKWFKETPFPLYLVFCIMLFNVSGLVFIAGTPMLYHIPIVASLGLTLAGLYFWLSSYRYSISSSDSEDYENFSFWRLFVGSLSMALVAGCRPQNLLISFLAIIIFYEPIKKGLKNINSLKLPHFIGIVCFAFPYIAVGLGMMFYNVIRFGSIFDFGSSYNLTIIDMLHRNYELARLPFAIYMYLFQPPNIKTIFPFVFTTDYTTQYLGIMFGPGMLGGIFINIVLLYNFLINKYKKELKDVGVFWFTSSALLIGIIILAFDAMIAGVSIRFATDFSIMFFIPAIVIIMATLNNCKSDESKRNTYSIILICLVVSVLYNGLSVFSNIEFSVQSYNTLLFNRMASIFQFWL